MKGKKVVITGAAGFIGSNLAQELASDNNIILIDDLSTGYLTNIEDIIDKSNVTFIEGSITDLGILQKIFKGVDYVFHEAAISSVPKSIKDPIRSNEVNINGTLNVLVAAKENSVKKIVYASSSSVYGDTPTLPKTEDMLPCPLSPYAVSKLTGEYYCQVFTRNYNLSTISLRYFNVYGLRQDSSNEYAAVIPKFITNVLNDKSPVIYGAGKQTRDFVFIDDIVNANISAAEQEATGIFNIASGKCISINDLAKSVIKICKKNLNLVYKTPRSGDIRHSSADISKAKKKLHYEPRFNLTEGLKKTVHWFQKRALH
jgi:UDP-glucose 4-epimerase